MGGCSKGNRSRILVVGLPWVSEDAVGKGGIQARMDTLEPQPPPPDKRPPRLEGVQGEPGSHERPLDRVWSILPRDFVREALERSLTDALGPHQETLGQDAVEEARQEASRLFLRAARQRARRVRGVTRSQVIEELREAHDELVTSRDRAQAELDDLESRTRLLRSNLEDTQPRLDEDVQGRLDASHEEQLRTLLKRYGRKANKRTDELVAELLEVGRKQQHEAMTEALAAYPERIALLERRMAKLKIALWRTEKSLRDLAGRADGVEGKASIFKSVQGLERADPMFLAKSGALRTLFEENVKLRKSFVQAEGA